MTTTFRSDETIKMDVVEQLYWDNQFDASDISVTVEDSHVTLEGSVSSYFDKNAVGASVLDVDGVTEVLNRLEVETPKHVESPSDEEVLNRVRQTLSWDTNIDSTQIDVSVSGGIVTLKGTVDQVWKKYRAEEEVAEISGVLNIENELTVVPLEDVEDKQIADELQSSLERNAYVDADSIDITVRDKVVILGGTVSEQRAVSEAGEVARKTSGVKRVENNINVDQNEQ